MYVERKKGTEKRGTVYFFRRLGGTESNSRKKVHCLPFGLFCLLAAPAVVMAAAAGARAAPAGETDYLALSAGAFNVEDRDRVAEFRIEYRSKLKWWIFKPFTGVMATTDEAFYGYGGILLDLHIGRRLVLTPSIAAGAYAQGEGRDLGHVLEFRSQIEIAYRFADQARLALSFGHMSNASISEDNPGVQSAMLTYAVPFGRLLGR